MEIEGSLPRSQQPAPVPLLSKIYPVHVLQFHFSQNHFNIILPPAAENMC